MKIAVISVFVAFALASIVSCFTFVSIFHISVRSTVLFVSLIFLKHRHYPPGLNLVWSKKLFFPGTHIFRLNFWYFFVLILFQGSLVYILNVFNKSALTLCSCLLQGYFNNVSEHLRIGPPLYFVVKNYNYRYSCINLFSYFHPPYTIYSYLTVRKSESAPNLIFLTFLELEHLLLLIAFNMNLLFMLMLLNSSAQNQGRQISCAPSANVIQTHFWMR